MQDLDVSGLDTFMGIPLGFRWQSQASISSITPSCQHTSNTANNTSFAKTTSNTATYPQQPSCPPFATCSWLEPALDCQQLHR